MWGESPSRQREEVSVQRVSLSVRGDGVSVLAEVVSL
jgi:hypothetical protein